MRREGHWGRWEGIRGRGESHRWGTGWRDGDTAGRRTGGELGGAEGALGGDIGRGEGSGEVLAVGGDAGRRCEVLVGYWGRAGRDGG